MSTVADRKIEEFEKRIEKRIEKLERDLNILLLGKKNPVRSKKSKA